MITTSLQLSITRGIQKKKIPVKQNRNTAQLEAAQPGDKRTISVPRDEQCGHGALHWSTTTR